MALVNHTFGRGRPSSEGGGNIFRRIGKLLDHWARQPQAPASAGYSVHGKDWPVPRLRMTPTQIEEALSRIDSSDVQRAREELRAPLPSHPTPSGEDPKNE